MFGLSLVTEGGFYLRTLDATMASSLAGCLAVAAGALLSIGLLTPIAGAIAGFGMLAVWFSILPRCMPNLFDSRLVMVFSAAILQAIIALGPGAFSFDARLFGRREIIIPSLDEIE